MTTPFLLAETPRGGPFGHRFLVPPTPPLRPTEVEAYFQRAALGPGSNFIAVNHQVLQRLPNGAVREGAETLLLAGLEVKELSNEQVGRIRALLQRLLPDLEQLVTAGINWGEEARPQTLLVREELADWLSQEIVTALARSRSPQKGSAAATSPRSAPDERSARLIGVLLALVVGASILLVWFF